MFLCICMGVHVALTYNIVEGSDTTAGDIESLCDT